jgi:hypothetical protein
MASDLVAGDYNNTRDIFVVRLFEDSDLDDLDDGWEMHFFGTLERDGKGDFDGDGLSDVQEFRRYSDPLAAHEGAQITGISRTWYYIPGGNVSEFNFWWTAVPGTVYQLQFSSAPTGSTWTNVAGKVTAGGGIAWNRYTPIPSFFEIPRYGNLLGKGFYRVVSTP